MIGRKFEYSTLFFAHTKQLIYISNQRQTTVAAGFSGKQLLLFVFELQDSLLPSSTGILTAGQRQTAVTAYLEK